MPICIYCIISPKSSEQHVNIWKHIFLPNNYSPDWRFCNGLHGGENSHASQRGAGTNPHFLEKTHNASRTGSSWHPWAKLYGHPKWWKVMQLAPEGGYDGVIIGFTHSLFTTAPSWKNGDTLCLSDSLCWREIAQKQLLFQTIITHIFPPPLCISVSLQDQTPPSARRVIHTHASRVLLKACVCVGPLRVPDWKVMSKCCCVNLPGWGTWTGMCMELDICDAQK